jgi:hypothetical protein
MSRKVFTAGEVLAAADVNSFLMDQTVMSFAGTAARGSAIPTPVEGMTTYLEDSNRLDFYDGSSFVPAAGLTHINTTSFSAVATQSVNGVFSSDYSNYRILVSPTTAGTNVQITIRLRASGADTSTNYASNSNLNTTATTVTANLNLRGTDEILVNGGISTGRPSFANIDIFNPFENLNTGFLINSGNELSDGSYFYTNNTTGILKDTLSYDGFTLIISGGSNFSGSLSVYGYRK